MNTNLSRFNEANNNMIELVIANNDEMALGAITALQEKGYNNGGNSKLIPVFGVDATEAAKNAIKNGTMIGTIKQDADGMAEAISTIVQNLVNGKKMFDSVATEKVVENWRVNIPYSTYLGN